ncbi:putative uncharacterized protein DDB_G0277003 isoform X7 [Rhodamnia argentea]|uniref:FAM86 N-terminal domain-containing protein n=1 Tax=Rhodamnia argentea TaxID=178133 RepID=A0ABM3HQ97_9MYRT|nr:putative uncharacterized protein DDB_G0277003 isoform X7 [Rhodamnia argentea]
MEKQTASLHLVSAFLAMEPTDCVLSHARSLGGGSVTVDVQRFVWDHCISKAIGKCHAPYLKHFLKKLILEIEANRDDVLDELYELYTEFMTSLKVGSGVGLVGICLSHVKASKVILSDGDLSTLSNMKLNLKMNQLSTSDDEPESSQCPDSFEPAQIGGIRTEIDIVSSHQVKCLHLPWECASEIELQGSEPDIILGADVIYDPLCLPHLVHLLSILVDKSKSSQFPRAGCDSAIGNSHDYSNRCNSQDVEAARDRAGNASPTKHPIAYISSVIRNANTFDRFLALVDKANLTVADLTGTFQPASLLPYMQSYDRSSIRLFRLSSK